MNRIMIVSEKYKANFLFIINLFANIKTYKVT